MPTVDLNTKKDFRGKTTIFGRVGDGELTTITVNLLDEDGKPYNLTGCTVAFKGMNSQNDFTDGVPKVVTANQGKIEYTFTRQNFAVPGTFKRAYFEINNGDKRTTSEDITIDVRPNADVGEGQVEMYLSILDELVEKFETMHQQKESEFDATMVDINKEWETYLSNFDKMQIEKATSFDAMQAQKEQQYSDLQMHADDLQVQLNELEGLINTNNVYTKSEVDGKFALKTDTVNLTGNQTIAGVKNFTSVPTVNGSNVLTETNGYKKSEVDGKFALKTDTVNLTGNQTIAGVKNFTSAPQVNGVSFGGYTNVIADETDLDFLIVNGNYAGTNLINTPIGGYCYIEVIGRPSNNVMQRLTQFASGDSYSRLMVNGVWLSWKKIATTNTTVNLTGNQTVAGVKNFTSTPQVNGAGLISQTDLSNLGLSPNTGTKRIDGVDLNTLHTTGFYSGKELVNKPTNPNNNGTYWYLEVIHHNETNNFTLQKATQLVTGYSASRVCYEGNWGNWYETLSSNSISVDANVTFKTGFSDYTSASPTKIRRIGNIVYLDGAITNTQEVDIQNGTVNVVCLTIPSEFRPKSQQSRFVNQGSGVNRHMVVINQNGDVAIGRNGSNSFENFKAASWINVFAMWFV